LRKIPDILRKFRGRSLDEFRVRGTQILNRFAERHHWSRSDVPNDRAFFKLLESALLQKSDFSAEGLLAHFRKRTSPRFFAAFEDPEATVTQLRPRVCAKSRETLIERARRITKGRFDLLELRNLDFGDPINWHLEPVSGAAAPRVHWSKIDYLDAQLVGDKKIIWELNRHQHLLTLGRAYWQTGDEQYAQTFASHIYDWVRSNPPKVGINWASSLEVAFRSISWLWALYFFRDSPHLTPDLFLLMLKFLYLHGRHLETFLSTYFSPNTHLTGEALGLFYLGTLLPELRCGAQWRDKGKTILLEQLERQVRNDGTYFEQSSYYHRYTTDFYLHFLMLLRQNDEPIEGFLEERLQALLDHLMYITCPDGASPLFGDDDGGRLVHLDDRAGNDFRNSLATGAVLFGRPDYKYVATELSEETLWLLGPRGAQEFDELDKRKPEKESIGFLEGGFYVMRDGWLSDSNYLLLDCGPHGSLRFGHAHADALSFELAARGRTLLIDPGTYTYTGSSEMRNYFRSSGAHNTLTVDGESSSVPDRSFSWKYVAKAQPLKWLSHARFDYFEGKHDGYERLASSVTHHRSVLFLKDDYWIVHDHLETTGSHQYDLHFHFAPEADPKIENQEEVDLVWEQNNDSSGLEIFAFAKGGAWHREEAWASRGYGNSLAAPAFRFSVNGTGAQDIVSVLVPRLPRQQKASVRRLAESAFEILADSRRDAFLIGFGQSIGATGIASDFRLTWARFADETIIPDELILVGGHSFCLNGQELIHSSDFINYVVLRRQENELHGESDQISDLRLSLSETFPRNVEVANK
jgi:hypothetical protein